jgi:hypothetical protein
VNADDLERRVREVIEKVVYDPSIVIHRLEEKEKEERKAGYAAQILYMDEQRIKLGKEKNKLEAAYQHDIYTLDEFEKKIIGRTDEDANCFQSQAYSKVR